MVFGDVMAMTGDGKRRPLSPMNTVRSPNPFVSGGSGAGSGSGVKKLKFTIGGKKKDVVIGDDGPGKADAGVRLEEGGMGVKDEAMGFVVGGKGLKEVGRSLEEEE